MTTPGFIKKTNLAAARLGAKTLYCSDDFFAAMENLLQPGRGIFIADKYTDRGKWMDGWESRRKRVPGHDWCVIQLATAGTIYGVDIDTNYFLGNHPPHASIEACYLSGGGATDLAGQCWVEILSKSPLQPGAQNLYEITDHAVYTHLRLHIYPDGGVARLKVYGEVAKDWTTIDATAAIDLAAAVNGATALLCNDMFFSHMDNLLLPGRGINMGDGWETRRNRNPGNKDWVIVKLAHAGIIDQILIDTHYFKGNYPDTCMVEGCTIAADETADLVAASIEWTTILPQVKLQADEEHYFDKLMMPDKPVTHVRLTIFPDGGVSRMRLFGRIVL